MARSDVAARYDTCNVADAWNFEERGGLYDLSEADRAR